MLKSFAFLEGIYFADDIKFPLRFTDHYIIRKFYDETFDLKEKLKEWELGTYHSTGHHPYIIEVIKEHEKKDFQSILDSIAFIVYLIRLVKYNAIYFSKCVCFQSNNVTQSVSLDEPRPSSTSEKDEIISLEDLKIIEKIIKRVRETKISNERVLRSLYFWNSSSCSGNFERKVIELFISLESLFTIEKEEVTYRLSNRMAWFLERSDSLKRLELFSKIKNGYSIRSRVVHGKKFVESKELPLIQEIHSLTRKTLLEIFLEKNFFNIFSGNETDLISYFNKLILGL